MKLAYRSGGIAALLLILGTGAAAGQLVPGAPSTDWERHRQEYTLSVLRDYNALMADWRAALRSGDAAELATSYDEGALLLVSGQQLVQGRDSIRAYLSRAMPAIVELRLGLVDFVASDRLAYAAGPLIYRYREPGAGTVQSLTGNHVTVLVRDGRRWRIRSQVLKYENVP